MRAKKRTRITRTLTDVCLLLAVGTHLAQEPAAPPPTPPPPVPEKPAAQPAVEPAPILDPAVHLETTSPPPALPQTPSPQMESITLFPDSAEQPIPSFQEDTKWHFVLHGSARGTFDSNIFITHDRPEEDFYFTVAAGIAVGRGDFRSEIFDLGSFRDRFVRDRSEIVKDKSYFFLNYIPSYTVFLNNSGENTFDHDLAFEGQWVIQKLKLGAQARFQTDNIPDQDLGERIERRLFNTALTALYDYSDKTSVELNARFSIRDYVPSDKIDVDELRFETWLNYQILPKIALSAGGAYGHVTVSKGPDQDYWQGLLRVRYKATEKFQLQASAGVEFRDTGLFGTQTNPVFSIGASYVATDSTSIYLTAYGRTQTSSSSAGTNYTLTGIEAQLRQRFLHRLYVVLAGGFQHSEYDSGAAATGPDRTDDSFYIRPAIGIDISKRCSAEASLEYRNVDSNIDKRTYDRLLVYLQFNVLF